MEVMGMKAGGSEQAGREHQHLECVAWVWPPEALAPFWAGFTSGCPLLPWEWKDLVSFTQTRKPQMLHLPAVLCLILISASFPTSAFQRIPVLSILEAQRLTCPLLGKRRVLQLSTPRPTSRLLRNTHLPPQKRHMSISCRSSLLSGGWSCFAGES